MSDLFHRYEDWWLSTGSRPTVLVFLVVFIVLSVVTYLGRKAWTKSLRAWFWFGLANVGAWGYLYWVTSLTPNTGAHVRLFLIHYVLLTGPWFCYTLARRILMGKEDAIERQSDRTPETLG